MSAADDEDPDESSDQSCPTTNPPTTSMHAVSSTKMPLSQNEAPRRVPTDSATGRTGGGRADRGGSAGGGGVRRVRSGFEGSHDTPEGGGGGGGGGGDGGVSVDSGSVDWDCSTTGPDSPGGDRNALRGGGGGGGGGTGGRGGAGSSAAESVEDAGHGGTAFAESDRSSLTSRSMRFMVGAEEEKPTRKP
ncbi:MAG: hypothetical protein OXB92_02375 [Acidimicrobiaceae bacterium]|nr:hypothetical protein [Acidimicrobiia bacterium]MCY4492688.1 hypothetical protein [Acidimicrobiaceae bacterium]